MFSAAGLAHAILPYIALMALINNAVVNHQLLQKQLLLHLGMDVRANAPALAAASASLAPGASGTAAAAANMSSLSAAEQ